MTLPLRTATTRPSSSCGEHVDVVADTFDDGRADEHGVDRSVAEHGHRQLRFEAFELATEGVALDGDVEQRQDGRVAVA